MNFKFFLAGNRENFKNDFNNDEAVNLKKRIMFIRTRLIKYCV